MIAHIARTMSDTDNDIPPVLVVEPPTGKGHGGLISAPRGSSARSAAARAIFSPAIR